jgi:hypothetical protein
MFMCVAHQKLVINLDLTWKQSFLIPLLIHFNFSSNVSITPDVGQDNLLAIEHSESFQTISSRDLHSFLHLRDTFFSKGRKVMETNLQKSWLGALYLANAGAIQKTYKF